jgi:large subunit ribosomal protein L10
MISREKKAQIVENLMIEIKKAKAIYLVNFLGLKVSEMDELREELRNNNSTIQVVKKNLAQVAFSKSGYKENIPYEKNGSLMVSIAFEDPFKTAKILWNFSKKNEKLQILGGIAENKFLNQGEVIQLAKISSLDILFGRIVGSMSSPTQRLLYVLNGNVQKLIVVLEGIRTAKSS